MRALLLTLVAVVLAGGCARAEAPTTVSPDRLRDVVLQAEDVPGFRRSDGGPPRVSPDPGRPVGTRDAWRVGFRSRTTVIEGVFLIEAEAEAFPDYTAAHRAFRRLIGKVDAHDLLTGLPTTRVPAPPIGVEARAWTAHLEPMTVASVVWRSGNVLSWIALHGPDRNEAMQTVIELAKRQDARIEAARV
jgi:hypothetical protein